jgi:hypothetical protein
MVMEDATAREQSARGKSFLPATALVGGELHGDESSDRFWKLVTRVGSFRVSFAGLFPSSFPHQIL